MTLKNLITSLEHHKDTFPLESEATGQVIFWIEKYHEFAFVKANLEGHITGSLLIVNPEKSKVLLMLHKKHQMWIQFGGHCDGEVDVRNVAIREFHEESGITAEPTVFPDIFHVDVHDIPVDKKGVPPHKHFDILYLAILSDDIPFSRQKSEVDDIRWFPLDEALQINKESRMKALIEKIRNLQ